MNKVEKMPEKKNVPALRFSEFDGEWEEKRLGELLTIGSGKDYKHLNSGDIPVYGTGGYMTSVDDFLFDGESVCIGRKGTIDKPVMLSGKFWTVDTLFYTHKYINALPKFIFAIFQKINWQMYNEASGVPSLSKSTIESIEIKSPALLEQQKIAEFLGAVDEKLTKLKAKRGLLEDYKRGLMQKLFSQEIRFTKSNGDPFPDWEEKKLGEVVKIYDGTHQTPDYVDYGVPFYSVEHLTSNNFEKTKYISEAVFLKESKRVTLKSDDILMTRIGDIGTAKLMDWDVRASFYVSLALLKQGENINNRFLTHFINGVYFQRELWKRTIHVAFPKKINLGEIGNCIVLIPYPDEQTLIADALSAMDAKINAVAGQITELETFKKGLLQQMFV